MHPILRRTTAAVLAVGSALALSGCAVTEQFVTFGVLQSPSERTLSIGVNPEDSEQLVIGEIYAQVLAAYGRPVGIAANTTFAHRSAMDTLREDNIDLVVSCTGKLLYNFDRATAQTLLDGSDADSSAPHNGLADQVYASLVSTFPYDIRTVDPSPAQGCEGSEAAELGLPENFVPLFKEGKLSRNEVKRLNFITRVMATEDIKEMAERVDKGEPAYQAISEWLGEYAGINPEHPETKDEDADMGAEPPV